MERGLPLPWGEGDARRSADAPDGDTAPSILGVQRINTNKINALNFLDQTYQRRPLLPYLCVMAGRSETDAEAIIRLIEDWTTEVYATASVEVIEGSNGKTAEERLKVADTISKTGRSLKLFRGAGRGVATNLAELRKLAPVREADAEETSMNANDAWTPERLAKLRADVERRLATFRGSLEYKRGVAAVRDADGGREGGGGMAASGGPPTSTR